MIKIGLAQIEISPANPRKNKETILRALAKGREAGVNLLIFPELALSGYLIGDLWEQTAFVQECVRFGEEIIAASTDIAIIFGNVGIDEQKRNEDGRLRKYNALFAAQNGQPIKPADSPYPFYIKTLTPNYRFFDEQRYFYSLPMVALENNISIEDYLSPFVFSFKETSSIQSSASDFTVIPLVCEDSWSDNYPLNPAVKAAAKARGAGQRVDLFVNSSCSPFTLGKGERRHKLFAAQAPALQAPVMYVNAVGVQNNGKCICTFDGHSTAYSSDGRPVYELPVYEERIQIMTLDAAGELTASDSFTLTKPFVLKEALTSKEASAATTNSASMMNTSPHPLLKTAGQFTPQSTTPSPSSLPSETKQIYEALHYGLKKTLAAFHITKVVIGVSGGIDSAVNAALYRTVLPAENVYLVNMPSRFNSAETKDMAQVLARNLGCPYAVFPIENSLKLTVEELTTLTFTRKQKNSALTEERNPILPSLLQEQKASASSPLQEEKITVSSFTQENIQARDRSSRILAAIAAAVGGAFTCNGNKTELSIGYATLYGDLAGFLAATADLWKYQIYALANYLNEEIYHEEIIPQSTINIIPSAELSHAQDVTKGLGDPLQYDYHDRLFRSFIEPWNRLTPEELALAYKENRLEELLDLPKPITTWFSTAEAFLADLERWWNLQSGFAVAKRIQSPPLIAVSRRAYGNDLHESQNAPYYTDRYYELKKELLSGSTQKESDHVN